MKEKLNIVHELEAKGWTEADIASKIGVSTKSVQYWKNGTHNPKGEKLRKLQALLDKPSKSEEMVEYDLGEAIKKIEATTAVILAAAAEILARASNRMTTTVHGELEELVNKRLNEPTPKQSQVVG